jgi:hypothetical protein
VNWQNWDRWFDEFRLGPSWTKPASGLVDAVLSWVIAAVFVVACIKLAGR